MFLSPAPTLTATININTLSDALNNALSDALNNASSLASRAFLGAQAEDAHYTSTIIGFAGS
jgi:hypothetical protein